LSVAATVAAEGCRAENGGARRKAGRWKKIEYNERKQLLPKVKSGKAIGQKRQLRGKIEYSARLHHLRNRLGGIDFSPLFRQDDEIKK